MFILRSIKNGFYDTSWHFVCIQWNGIDGSVSYFHNGYSVGIGIKNEILKTELQPGKFFNVDTSDRIGKLTQLNIWDYEIEAVSIIAMSSGGFNIHGNVLSWRKFVKFIPTSSINWNTEIYLPGKIFSMVLKRTCNDLKFYLLEIFICYSETKCNVCW